VRKKQVTQENQRRSRAGEIIEERVGEETTERLSPGENPWGGKSGGEGGWLSQRSRGGEGKN